MKQLSIVFIFFLAVSNSKLHGQNVRQEIIQEFEVLSKLYDFDVKLNFTKQEGLSSHPINGVNFGSNEVQKISNIKKKSDRKFILLLLLSHELAHQAQFKIYKGDKEKLSDNPASRTTLEAQADVIAGHMTFNALIDQSALNLVEGRKGLNRIRAIFQYMSDIGIRENTLGNHPSRNERQMCVRLGFGMGMFQYFNKIRKENPKRLKSLKIKKSEISSLFSGGRRFLDYDPRELDLHWSYRMSQKIVNQDRRLSRNLILTTAPGSRHSWNLSSSRPYVSYKLNYRNIGDEPLNVDLSVYVSHVERENPNIAKYHRVVNVRSYRFEILPDDNKLISGTMNWNNNDSDFSGAANLDKEFMPRIVYPGGNGDSWISISSSKDISSIENAEPIEYLNLSEIKDEFSSLYVQEIALRRLVRAIKLDKADNLKIGVGNYLSKGSDLEKIDYHSSIQFDENSTTLVMEDLLEGTDLINIDLGAFNTWTDANIKFDQVRSTLIDMLSDFKVSEHDIQKMKLVYFESGGVRLSLRVISSGSDTGVSISISRF